MRICLTEPLAFRDVKRENVLVGGDGRVCLADFGRAVEVGDGEALSIAAGTPEYSAPEVMLAATSPWRATGAFDMFPKLEHGTAADVWAFGILAYELLVGETPYEDADGHEGNAWVPLALAVISRGPKAPPEWVRHQPRVHAPALACSSHIMLRIVSARHMHASTTVRRALLLQVSADALSFLGALLTPKQEERPTMDSVLTHRWLQCVEAGGVEATRAPRVAVLVAAIEPVPAGHPVRTDVAGMPTTVVEEFLLGIQAPARTTSAPAQPRALTVSRPMTPHVRPPNVAATLQAPCRWMLYSLNAAVVRSCIRSRVARTVPHSLQSAHVSLGRLGIIPCELERLRVCRWAQRRARRPASVR